MKKYILSIILLVFFNKIHYSQEANTVKVWRINFLNPAIELELPTSSNTTFSAGLGIGYGGAYPQTSNGGFGFLYSFNPFLDLQQKWFYNFSKRKSKNRSNENNSGNFVSARLLTRGNTIDSNFNRTTDFDFAVGPTWGLQRKYGKNFHFLFDVGPIYYFDTNGKGYIFPIMFQLNLGFDLKLK
ncbi:MAG: hypothetical protein GW772_03410 [Flavobacteriia bacterium]|nr:hypothetical protein [Flavobacteriia bacterium]OIP46694.1 MAG: hypothetical protein AUK46_07635 [Flavobacteriaceae bacterium CG2_30_31_66]PIV97905.1 MAG: hypothetical protein COW43_00410 [Flavobacteriaceae bacterium CG17_big_fil_post_rev_8_21_14_2_50_31_13]PIX11680.1 MAG: hypothetical protein COZ74_13235 [Flavobacteriaceae bacterium CG_4_8_14_3_um_filter_31_8]PIY16180.1 MAG: hypothetical protein COZ16_01090 [Flavobacteriaceae bacterium CG_4_10_14_3_um_filter_31_253]PIZ11267.1 MAG: hypotheti